MGVPVGARAWSEANQADDHPRRLLPAIDRIHVDVTSEIAGRRLGSRADRSQFHDHLSSAGWRSVLVRAGLGRRGLDISRDPAGQQGRVVGGRGAGLRAAGGQGASPCRKDSGQLAPRLDADPARARAVTGQPCLFRASPGSLTITTMDPDHQRSARYTVILLEWLWRKSGERLAARCRGLADEELLWEP